LLAVDAAFFRSEPETFEGSLPRLLAVLSAACLSAHDVPVLGAVSAVEDVVILVNRFCSSFSCGPLLAVAGGDTGAAAAAVDVVEA
jgi:hypothetical protein